MREQQSKRAGGRISAHDWNELYAQVRRNADLLASLTSPREGTTVPSCVEYCMNDSGYDAPMHAVCQLQGRVATESDILKFDYYRAQYTFACGILLEPIPDGKMGQVAVHGGPVKVYVSESVSKGDLLQPEVWPNIWQVKPGVGIWLAVTDSYGDFCWVVWRSPNAPPLMKATTKIGSSSATARFVNTSGDMEGPEISVATFSPSGSHFVAPEGAYGFLVVDSGGAYVFVPLLPHSLELLAEDPGPYDRGLGAIWFRSS